MITVSIAGTNYDVKTSFDEVDIFEYLEWLTLADKPIIERVAAYTGIPVDKLNLLTIESFNGIAGTVAFIEDKALLNVMCESYTGINVGLESYGKIEKAKQLLTTNGVMALPDIVEIYTSRTCPVPLLFAWGACQFYLDGLTAFFAQFAEMKNFEYSEEEIEAGVETLGQMQHYPTVFKIGRERGLKNDEVLAIPAIEIYMELLQSFREAQYSKQLTEIKKQRAEHFGKLNK